MDDGILAMRVYNREGERVRSRQRQMTFIDLTQAPRFDDRRRRHHTEDAIRRVRPAWFLNSGQRPDNAEAAGAYSDRRWKPSNIRCHSFQVIPCRLRSR